MDPLTIVFWLVILPLCGLYVGTLTANMFSENDNKEDKDDFGSRSW